VSSTTFRWGGNRSASLSKFAFLNPDDKIFLSSNRRAGRNPPFSDAFRLMKRQLRSRESAEGASRRRACGFPRRRFGAQTPATAGPTKRPDRAPLPPARTRPCAMTEPMRAQIAAAGFPRLTKLAGKIRPNGRFLRAMARRGSRSTAARPDGVSRGARRCRHERQCPGEPVNRLRRRATRRRSAKRPGATPPRCRAQGAHL
jgi:hypothetical protein